MTVHNDNDNENENETAASQPARTTTNGTCTAGLRDGSISIININISSISIINTNSGTLECT